jgi:hypothetical protein
MSRIVLQVGDRVAVEFDFDFLAKFNGPGQLDLFIPLDDNSLHICPRLNN